MNPIYLAIISLFAGIIIGTIIGIWICRKDEIDDCDYFYGDYL